MAFLFYYLLFSFLNRDYGESVVWVSPTIECECSQKINENRIKNLLHESTEMPSYAPSCVIPVALIELIIITVSNTNTTIEPRTMNVGKKSVEVFKAFFVSLMLCFASSSVTAPCSLEPAIINQLC